MRLDELVDENLRYLDDAEEIGYIDDGSSEDEMEEIHQDDHSSDSELSQDECEEEICEDNGDLSTDEDGLIWLKNPPRTRQTRARNILRFTPGPVGRAKNVNDEVDAFSFFVSP